MNPPNEMAAKIGTERQSAGAAAGSDDSSKVKEFERTAMVFAAMHFVAFWHKADSQRARSMSAFGGKADIGWRCRDVCF
jgi:hypothetical protein